jgi:hypothetical protein
VIGPLALVPAWAWAAGVAAVLAAGAAYHFVAVSSARAEGDKAGAARVNAMWDAQIAQAQATAASAALANANETARRERALRKEAEDAQAVADRARRDADRAAAAAVSLRDAARKAGAACGGASPADPRATASGPPAGGRLLAEVLGELDDFAGAVAAEADRRGIAGSACERAYDSLRG